jgi:tRNA A-37 threonylcarbamoyl transferase component Bud32/tetratricopeptide (TPR) repeat protein
MCPGDTQIMRFLEGRLEGADAALVDEHADHCEQCRELISSMMLVRSPGPPPAPSAAAPSVAGADGVGRRYLLLGLIGQGGMGRVFRALDRLAGQTVALKRVSLRADLQGSLAVTTRMEALAREFRTLATLAHPNIISVLDYGFDSAGQPYFTMELLSGARPVLQAAAAAPPGARMDLLVQILRALGYLHRRGVLHLDLKPSNILVVDRGGGPVVKVLDFGLASGSEESRRERTAAGTLAYLAPELFRGAAPSESSDLYAAGVLACEILSGRHPFPDALEPAALIDRVLHAEPDLSRLSPALRGIVGRALSRSPLDRPADAGAFLRELTAAAGIEPAGEPAGARDSYLVSARFTGRDEELGQLCQALEEARQGRGSAWLVAGESGVGKSRLVEELRSRAIVRGVLAVRGQAQPDGATAYHLWQRALEILALHVELSELEAGVLGVVVPRLGALLEREIAPPPELAAQATRLRLLSVLREVVERSREPVLVILEDLHAADPESLELLAQVSGGLGALPLLVVATYRDDEAPALTARLRAMRPVRLRRFDRGGVERLCESMLGSAGRDPRLVDLVARETEGNAYFVVEVARALAEESGSLADIGRHGLPDRVLAGGVEQVLGRRLARVPDEARPLLRLAAVAGRELDLEVLAHGLPEASALAQRCAEVGVLELHEQRWRFSHDHLRERVLGSLAEPERRALHAGIARGLEAAYPGSAAHASAKAHHHREAGQLLPAARFSATAAEAALAGGAPGEAEAMLQEVLTLHDRVEVSRLERVRAWRMLAHARLGLGRPPEADVALQRLCEIAGTPLPDRPGRWWLMFLRQIGELLLRRAGLWRPSRMRAGGEARALREEVLLGISILEIYIFLDRPELALLCTLWGRNLEESLGLGPFSTGFRAALSFLLAYTPLRGVSLRSLERALSTVAPGSVTELGYLRARALALANDGRWEEAAASAGQAVSNARALKDDVSLVQCLLPFQIALGGHGRYQPLLESSRELERVADRIGNPRYLSFAFLWQALVRLRFAEFARVAEALASARRSMPEGMGPLSDSIALGLEAASAFHQGDVERAQALAVTTMGTVDRVRWTLVELRNALACVLEVWLSTGADGRHDARIRPALARLRRIARQFPCAVPNDHLFRGRFLFLQGRPGPAVAEMRRSLESAQRLDSRYERARAHYWLGCFAQAPAARELVPEGAVAHLRAALSQFEFLGCSWEADLARKALSIGATA